MRRRYSSDEVDFIAAHCHELNRNFLIPIGVVDGQSGISLRLSPPRNAQRAAIQFAEDYAFPGAVAQLEVAPRWQRGGRGFESRQLHSPEQPQVTAETVGAHVSRNHFGYYMERAASGTEIRVTRRGRPYVRLVPYQQPLTKAA